MIWLSTVKNTIVLVNGLFQVFELVVKLTLTGLLVLFLSFINCRPNIFWHSPVSFSLIIILCTSRSLKSTISSTGQPSVLRIGISVRIRFITRRTRSCKINTLYLFRSCLIHRIEWSSTIRVFFFIFKSLFYFVKLFLQMPRLFMRSLDIVSGLVPLATSKKFIKGFFLVSWLILLFFSHIYYRW